MTAEDVFNLEMLKLLLTVAWKDRDFDVHERNMIVGLGRSWLVPEDELQALLGRSGKDQAPPEIDWTLLRSRKDDVLNAARALVLTDGKVNREETDLLKEIQKNLG